MAKPPITGNFTARSLARINRDLGILTLDKKRKGSLLKNAMKRVIKEARDKIRKQKDPQGGGWKARQKAKLNDKGKPQKMLMRILRTSAVRIEGDSCIFYYKNKGVGNTAARHNYGGESPSTENSQK